MEKIYEENPRLICCECVEFTAQLVSFEKLSIRIRNY